MHKWLVFRPMPDDPIPISEKLGLPQPPTADAPEIPESRHDLRVLTSIRRIIRAADLFSRRLAAEYGITVPQLLCLTKVVESGGITIKELANDIFLSPSTVVGIIDRLETRNLVERHRSAPDKRLVRVEPTSEAELIVKRSPSPLHENLIAGFGELSSDDQTRIADALEELVALMEIEQVSAAPILETEPDLDRPVS